MSKKEQLIEYAIQDLVEYICVDAGVEYDIAMAQLYNTELFRKLCDTETGLYLESPAYLYDLYTNETRNGKLVQQEI